MELASIIIAIASVIVSAVTYITTVMYERRKATIEAFNVLQNEVLDKFVCVKKENANMIIENLDDSRCKEAYDDYRALIARLEQFAVGVNKKIYAYKVVDMIAGRHFICLYKKIKPIIDKANEKEEKIIHYCNFVALVEKLNRKYNILIQEAK